KCPILAPAKTLLPENAARLGIDRTFCLENLQRLKLSPSIRDKVTEIFNEERHFAPSINVETELYNGFFDYNDKNNMAILRHLPEEKLAEHGLAFKDARIPKLLFHYRARHYFNSLTRAEQIQWQKYRHKKLDQVALQFEQSLQRLIAENSENPTNLTLLQKVYEYGAKILA
ncbi:exonuclease I, partial [Pasteurella multocida subsp. multocida str. Anand1_buffalo]